LDGAIGQGGQYVGKILTNGNAQFVAALDDAEDSGDLGSGLFASQVQPIAAADRNGAHRIFLLVCGQLDDGMVEEASQFRPALQRVVDGLARHRLRQDYALLA